MNHFHIWCNLKPGESDVRFGESVREMLGWLHEREFIEGYSIARRGFVIAPPDLGEFHVTVEFRSIEQMDRTLAFVSNGSDGTEELYRPLVEMVRDVSLSMDRDYPEEMRDRRHKADHTREETES